MAARAVTKTLSFDIATLQMAMTEAERMGVSLSQYVEKAIIAFKRSGK
jgi:hypothetical protein